MNKAMPGDWSLEPISVGRVTPCAPTAGRGLPAYRDRFLALPPRGAKHI